MLEFNDLQAIKLCFYQHFVKSPNIFDVEVV